MTVIPQTTYAGDRVTPKQKVYWDGADGPLLTGSLLCFDLSVGDGKTVSRPASIDLSAMAGVYDGDQGGSIASATWIDIVPAGSRAIVTILAGSANYADNEGVIAANGSFAGGLASGNGNAAIVEAGYIGIAIGGNGTTTSPKVLLNG